MEKELVLQLSGLNLVGSSMSKKPVDKRFKGFKYDRKRVYREKNREMLRLKAKSRKKCEFCGKYFSMSNRQKHLKTKRCQAAQKKVT